MTTCEKCKEASRGTFVGQGFTDYTCIICGKEETWHNTDVPKFCRECSDRLNICQKCGASLDEEKK